MKKIVHLFVIASLLMQAVFAQPTPVQAVRQNIQTKAILDNIVID